MTNLIQSPYPTVSVLAVIDQALQCRCMDRPYSPAARNRFRKMALKQFGQTWMEYEEFLDQIEQFMEHFESRHMDPREEEAYRSGATRGDRHKEREAHKEGVPTIISDEMDPQYHEHARKIIESKSEWRKADRDHGSMTLSPQDWVDPGMQPPDTTVVDKQERRADIRQARKAAVELFKAGNTPFTEDQKQLFRQEDERISQQLGYDVGKIWKPKRLRGSKRKQTKSEK